MRQRGGGDGKHTDLCDFVVKGLEGRVSEARGLVIDGGSVCGDLFYFI